ncbi:MAG: 2-dehydropantoate 2-reductase [Spartobacteria bacterium]
MPTPFRIGVVGSGAIGGYYGGKLAAAGQDVHFLMRGDLAGMRREGLRLSGPDEDVRISKLNVYDTTKEMGVCDLVLIALKATANEHLVDLIPSLLGDETMLMTLQNGLGNEEFLAKHFGAERVMAGLCFICLSRISRTVIERYDRGHLIIGEFDRPPLPRTREIEALFQEAGVECKVAENLALERWRKLVWNIPFNGLSILAGSADTAAILADATLRASTLATMEEVIDAANRCGFSLEQSAAAEQIERTEEMGAYKPSTLLDFEAGKPLEIEAIWGEPLRRAVAAGAKVPRMELLYSLLKHVDLARHS